MTPFFVTGSQVVSAKYRCKRVNCSVYCVVEMLISDSHGAALLTLFLCFHSFLLISLGLFVQFNSIKFKFILFV